MSDENKKESPYLTGKLLLAMPRIGDPRFDHAVILICSHDAKGAMGLVVNQYVPDIEFKSLLEQLDITSDIKLDPDSISIPVMKGGPVDVGRGFLLHDHDFQHEETIRVDDHFGITGTVSALKQVAKGEGPENMLFILGYSGWSAGQLDAELQKNAWLVTDPHPDLIFNNSNEEKWSKAVSSLGFDPAMLSSDAGHA